METFTDDLGNNATFHGMYLQDCEPVAVISNNNGLEITSPYTEQMLQRNLNGGDEQLIVNLTAADIAAHNAAVSAFQDFEANGSDVSGLKSWEDFSNPDAAADPEGCGLMISDAQPSGPGRGTRYS